MRDGWNTGVIAIMKVVRDSAADGHGPVMQIP